MSDKVIVTVNEGKIRGVKKKSAFSGVDYYSFLGIPYGQSTAGLARFKDPVKVKPWKTTLDGTIEKEGCSQFAVQLERFAGSEDCLYNNIHTPALPTEGGLLKPVIVSIHPGGFFHGSPDTFYHGSPEFVMNQDIVYVCIGFRLHILGFLNLDLEECSGNQGLKDIILSLQWIKENISVFGGNPNNITLLGSSSGSAIVHCLMLSPLSKGLFHKAIMMGMYAFNPTLVTRSKNEEKAFVMAADLGYESARDNKKLLSFYKKKHVLSLLKYRPEVMFTKKKANFFPCSPFLPTVDQGENSVLPEAPNKLINSTARVPLMFGICQQEAVMGFAAPYRKGTMENFYKSYLQNCWGWGSDMSENDVKLIKKQIDQFYFKSCTLETAPLSLKVDVQTDIACSNVYNTLIDVVSADLPSSVFVYKFEYDGNDIYTMKSVVTPLLDEKLEGTYHAADYSYWAYVKGPRWRITIDDLQPETRQMIETFSKLISTFARTGYYAVMIKENWKK